MVAFGITYDSNLEFGQIIQKCECADAVVMVEPGYERDAAPIPSQQPCVGWAATTPWKTVVEKSKSGRPKSTESIPTISM